MAGSHQGSDSPRPRNSSRARPWTSRADRVSASGVAPAHSPREGQTPQAVGFFLSQVGYETARRFGKLMSEVNLEPRQFALMRTIAASQGQQQNTLGEWLGIAPSSMVAVIDDLEARGLVERRPHPTDRRSRTLFLTEDGQKVLEGAIERASELEQTVCGGFSENERRRLLKSLGRVADNLGMLRGLTSRAFPPRCSPESAD